MGVKYSFPANLRLSGECLDLIRQIFVANPAKRVTLKGLKQHPWFLQNLPDELKVRCCLTVTLQPADEAHTWIYMHCRLASLWACRLQFRGLWAGVVHASAHDLWLSSVLPVVQDGGMAVRARMTPSHQSVEDVRRCVREAQAKGAGHGPQLPMSEFNEEVRLETAHYCCNAGRLASHGAS